MLRRHQYTITLNRQYGLIYQRGKNKKNDNLNGWFDRIDKLDIILIIINNGEVLGEISNLQGAWGTY
jgi:hypothetical protein